MGIVSDLESILPGGVLSAREELIPYSRDASHYDGELPAAVVLPRTSGEVSAVLKYCSGKGIPVVARGGGTSLTGASIPVPGAVVMSLMRMDRVMSVSVEDRVAEVQAGVRIDALNRRLAGLGQMFPPDPGSSIAATVGGIINTNAGGLRCVRYGTTKDWILGVEAVLMDGTVLQFGNRTLKSRIGYDLTSLLVGSEGTLAVVTRAYVKIVSKPQAVARLLAYFSDIESLGRAVADVKAAGMEPLIAEYLDGMTMKAVESTGTYKFAVCAPYVLLLDLDGPEEALSRYVQEASSLLRRSGATEISSTTDRAELDTLYTARKGAYSSLLKLRRSERDVVLIGDIVVPPSTLPAVLRSINSIVESEGIRVALFGHIGDGNIHANIFFDQGDSSERARVEHFHSSIARVALEHGGSVSAEHGIGLEKMELLREEYRYRRSEKALELMKGIKSVFDPKGLLNPGKVLH